MDLKTPGALISRRMAGLSITLGLDITTLLSINPRLSRQTDTLIRFTHLLSNKVSTRGRRRCLVGFTSFLAELC